MKWVNLSERKPVQAPGSDGALDVFANVVIRQRVEYGWSLSVIPYYTLMCLVGPGIEKIEWLEGAVNEVG